MDFDSSLLFAYPWDALHGTDFGSSLSVLAWLIPSPEADDSPAAGSLHNFIVSRVD